MPNAKGDLVLHPIPTDWGAALFDVLNAFDDEFVALIEAGQTEQSVMQDREPLCRQPDVLRQLDELTRVIPVRYGADLLDPSVIERVLRNDATVCGKRKPLDLREDACPADAVDH